MDCRVTSLLSHLPEDIAKEALAVRERADAEDLRDGLAEIGERRARADVGARA